MSKIRFTIAGIIILLLIICTVSPVLAAEERIDLQSKEYKDDLRVTEEKFSHSSHEGYDEKHHCPSPVPPSYSAVVNLTIDGKLINATSHWFFLAAGKTEQTALLTFIRKADISEQKKARWSLFLMKSWMKYPVKYIKTENGAELVPGNDHSKFSLNARENATFQEIETYIAEQMGQAAADQASVESGTITVQWAEPLHSSFTSIACGKESIPDDLTRIASLSSVTPDTWYNYPGGIAVQSINHGYVPDVLPGIGLLYAPDNCGNFASTAKTAFQSHNYQEAFTNLGYANHFMEDMGQPYHTPPKEIIGLAFIDDPSYVIKPAVLGGVVINYKALHDAYETFASNYWNQPLPNNEASFDTTASQVPDYYFVYDPTVSARRHGSDSASVAYPLIYDGIWHFIQNGNLDFATNPTIIARTKERVYHTEEYTRGLIRYVTGGQPFIVIISATAGPGGTITPSGSTTISYGTIVPYTVSANSGYVIDDVKIDGSSIGGAGQQTMSQSIPATLSDHTISATFKSVSAPSTDWIWSRDGWGDWQHSWSTSGTQVGPNSEYGPVMVGDHGEHGTNTNLLAGSTQSSVWKTFTDPSGNGWNTVEFNGVMTSSDVPYGRWMTMDINSQQVFGGTAVSNPPGNGVPFTVKKTFPQSSTVTVRISNGQNPAWGPRFAMSYYSVKLSNENTLMTMAESGDTLFVIPDGSEFTGNVTASDTPVEGIVTSTVTTEIL